MFRIWAHDVLYYFSTLPFISCLFCSLLDSVSETTHTERLSLNNTVHFFSNNFSCCLFILSFLFESFCSCYIFIVASIISWAPLIGLWNKFRFLIPIFTFVPELFYIFSLKLVDRSNDRQLLLPDAADFLPSDGSLLFVTELNLLSCWSQKLS